MSVLRQFNYLGQIRVDVPHLRSVESSIAADFDVIVGRGIAGARALVVKGFTLANTTAGTNASDVQLITAGGIVYNINAAESGSFLWIPDDRSPEVLSSTNSKLTGSFTASTVNYVGIDFKRTADDSTTDLAQFLDANTLKENGRNIPLGRTLDYVIYVSTAPFSTTSNITPVAKITTDSSNRVVTVEDARPMQFRLGSGGDFPNYQSAYTFPFGRQETLTSDKFTGGDKNIPSLKDWMDAVMTRTWEIGGGENWYSPTADRNVRMIRSVSSVFSNGDNFELSTTNVHWRGLTMLFDNANSAGVYYNDIADQLVNDGVRTQLAVGECLYVDIDRTANRTAGTALVAQKGVLQSLGTPTVPGSRYVIAWRSQDAGGIRIYTRDSYLYVGALFTPATTTSIGAVKLHTAPTNVAQPMVATMNETNFSLTIAAIAGNSYAIQGTGNGSGPGIQGIGGPTGYGVNAIASVETVAALHAIGFGVLSAAGGLGADLVGAQPPAFSNNSFIGGTGARGTGGRGQDHFGGANITAGSGGIGIQGIGGIGGDNFSAGIGGPGGTGGSFIGGTGGQGTGNVPGAGGTGLIVTGGNSGTVGSFGGFTGGHGIVVTGGASQSPTNYASGNGIVATGGSSGGPTGLGGLGGVFTATGIGQAGFGNIGVQATASFTGTGILGSGDTNAADTTVAVPSTFTPGPGTGGAFIGATGLKGGDGVQGFAQGTGQSRNGVYGAGNSPTTANIAGGLGGKFLGGTATAGNANGGNGVSATGGTKVGSGTDGFGLEGIGGGSNGSGIFGNGTGAGSGVVGQGGGTNGTGGTFAGGGANGKGVVSTASGTGAAFHANSIIVAKAAGGNPASTTAYTNELTAKNIAKAWAFVSVAAGVATVNDGFNITSATVVGNTVEVNLASAMANTNGACIATSLVGPQFIKAGMSSTTKIQIVLWTSAGVIINPGVTDIAFNVVLYAAQ